MTEGCYRGRAALLPRGLKVCERPWPTNVPSRMIGELTFPEVGKRAARELDPLPADRLDRTARPAFAAQHRRRAGRGIHPPHRRALGRDLRSVAAADARRSASRASTNGRPARCRCRLHGMTRAAARPRARDRARACRRAISRSSTATAAIAASWKRWRRICAPTSALNVCVLHPARLDGSGSAGRPAGNPWRQERNLADAGDRAASGAARCDRAAQKSAGRGSRAPHGARPGGDLAVDDRTKATSPT